MYLPYIYIYIYIYIYMVKELSFTKEDIKTNVSLCF